MLFSYWDRERIRDEVDSFLRGSPNPNIRDPDLRLVLYDLIPGVGVGGPILDRPRAGVAPAAQEARHARIMLFIMLNTILNIMLSITLVTFVASVGAQVLVNDDDEDLEDYADSCDVEDEDVDEDEDEDEVNTHPQEAPNSGIAPASMSAQALTSFNSEQEDHGYSADEEVDTNPQKVERVQKVTPNNEAEVDPAAQHEPVNQAGAAVDHIPLTSSSRTTTLQQEQATHGVAVTSPATSNTIPAPTEALKGPGVESIKEEVDSAGLALRAEYLARHPGTGGAHSAISTFEFGVTSSVTTDATTAATNHAEVTTRVQPSLDPIRDQEGVQKEVKPGTPSHESTAGSSST